MYDFGRVLPCSYGGCDFSKDENGILDRTGACPNATGIFESTLLVLEGNEVKGLSEGVFSNMGACK